MKTTIGNNYRTCSHSLENKKNLIRPSTVSFHAVLPFSKKKKTNTTQMFAVLECSLDLPKLYLLGTSPDTITDSPLLWIGIYLYYFSLQLAATGTVSRDNLDWFVSCDFG